MSKNLYLSIDELAEMRETILSRASRFDIAHLRQALTKRDKMLDEANEKQKIFKVGDEVIFTHRTSTTGKIIEKRGRIGALNHDRAFVIFDKFAHDVPYGSIRPV